MATISDLNVRLGLLYKDFDSNLKKVERNLERSGRKFSQLGNDLALSISLPLAALGAAAIKQAGEIESLKLAMVSTFENAGKSAADATKEVELLRQAAKAPGLDFEQAIKGSIRLQGVGLAAEDARLILERMANAIALTGGTAEDLDGVTRQFAQMISKGRVLQEDVSIISERMPVIAELMQKAFGTRSVEAIRASGVSASEFVQKITEAAGSLKTVEGGIKNALVNAASEARNSLATLGETIVKTFDVKGKLDTFTNALQGVVSWFSGLSDATKGAIIQATLFVGILGPLVKIIGVAMSTGGIFITIIRGIGAAVAAVASGALTATAAFNGLTLAMRATVIGAVLTAVTALYIGINYLSDSMDTAANAGKSFGDAQKYVAQESAKELSVLNSSISVLSDVTSSQEARGTAIGKLVSQYPEYLEGINLELQTAGQLAVIQRELTNEIIKGAAARAKANAQAELSAQIVEKELKIFKLRADQQEGGFSFQDLSFIIQNEEQKLKSLREELEKVGQTFDQVFAANNQGSSVINIVDPKSLKAASTEVAALTSATKTNSSAVERNAESIKKTKDETEAARDAYKKLRDEWSKPVTLAAPIIQALPQANPLGVGPQASNPADVAGGASLGMLSEGLSAMNALTAAIPGVISSLTPLQQKLLDMGGTWADAVQGMNDRTMSIGEAWKQMVANMKAEGKGMGDAVSEIAKNLSTKWEEGWLKKVYEGAVTLGNNIVALQQQNATNEKADLDAQYAAKLEAAKGNADATAQLQAELAAKKNEIDKKAGRLAKKLAIGQAIVNTAVGVTKALSAGWPVGAILGALTAAAGAVQIATIKAQPFAKGGVITSPTFGLMGEYPGAKNNPEIVTPERLMRSVFREESGAGGRIEVFGSLSAEGIHIANVMGERRRGRVR
jgi:tape measure domain-containing protein